MRQITKTLSLPADGKSHDFRLTKLDAFSGVSLLRMLSRIPDNAVPYAGEGASGSFVGSGGAEGTGRGSLLFLFTSLPDSDLRSLMTACLEHAEVSLPAGWHPVMTRGEWTYPELEHDTAACLRLTIEEVLWTLDGFFGGGASGSPPGTPAT